MCMPFAKAHNAFNLQKKEKIEWKNVTNFI